MRGPSVSGVSGVTVTIGSALLAALFVVLFARVDMAAAGAGDGSYDSGVSVEPTATGVVVEVEAWSDGTTAPIGQNPLAGCTVVTGLTGTEAIDYAGGRGILVGITDPAMEASDSSYTFISCPTRVFNGFGWAVWEESDPPPPAVVDALVAAARAAIRVPDLTPQSAPDGLATPFLTQLPVWLWVPEASWTPVSGTAALPEIGLAVTATATPVSTEWQSTEWLPERRSEGRADTTVRAPTRTTALCGAGTPWADHLTDDDTDCSIVFTSTTPPGSTIDLRVTTTYDIDIVCTPGLCDPAAIAVPDLAVAVARPVTVTEARGVIVR